MSTVEFRTGAIRPVECFKEGWELIKDEYWLIFGITFVGMLIGGIVPLAIMLGAMYCGIYYVLLQKMNHQPVRFEDLFKGFNYFLPSLIATLIFIIPVIIFMLFSYASVFAVLFSMTDSRGGIGPEAVFALYLTLIVEGVIFAVVLGCVHALIIFTYPLIVEHNLSGMDAFKTSARAVWANLSGVVSLILLEFALGFIGYLLCGIGLYFVMPILFAGVLVAYRRVFPNFQYGEFSQPPPPTSFQDAGQFS